ncbi:hypothetical protein LSAT2_013823 [Lamellibrachia satsuma]|nr:hypothetical protein LSAT2_013823 [Lamellibrachia satsuma]
MRKSGAHKLDKKTSVPRCHDKPRRPGGVLLLQPSSTFTAVGTACVLFRLLRVVAGSLKALELFKDDITEKEKDQRKKQKQCSNITQTVFTKRKGVKKEMRKLKQQAARNHGIRKKKTLVDDSAKFIPRDNTLANVEQLTRLTQLRATHATTVSKIIEHNKGNLAKDRLKKEEQPRQNTVFTDKDFDVFEKEYIS